MNKADNLSEKSCNSLVFEDEAKVLTFACITTDNVKDFPLLLGEVETNRVVAPENATEAKQLAANAEKLRKQGCKVSTKDVAETRLRRGRSVTKQKLEAKTNDAKTEGSSR